MTDQNPSADEVIAFLHQHPDFFKAHPRVLAELNLTHDTGDAVSLIQRQVDLLRGYNTTNRQRLVELSQFAKESELLLKRIQTLSVKSATANTPEQAVQLVTEIIMSEFEIPAAYCLCCDDSLAGANTLILSKDELSDVRSSIYNLPLFLGRPPAKLRELAFESIKDRTASIAMARIQFRKMDAYLVIGHSDPSHFSSDMGTEFIEYIRQYFQALLARF